MPLDATLSVRMEVEEKQRFQERCEQYHRAPQELLREIIVAFNDGRLKITPTQNQTNQMKDLYQ